MKPIQIAIQHMGNATRLAEALGVTTQAICFWRDETRKVPAERCPQIEQATGGLVRCEDLRPDVAWSVIETRHLRNPSPAHQAKPATESVAQGV